MTNEEAIRILNEQKNKFMDEWGYFSGINEAYNMAIKALTKKIRERPERLLPCKCGCKRREHWFWMYGGKTIILKCSKCGFTVSGKNEIDVHKAWNIAINDALTHRKG